MRTGQKMKQPDLTSFQRDQLFQRIDQLEQKIDFFITNAQKQGEEGNIDESEKIMIEVEKHRAQKTELEAILSGAEPITALEPEEPEMESKGPDRNMKVCEICGALQSAADTESRLQMHLEGKLHQGYQKIREQLKEFREKQRNMDGRRIQRTDRSRSRDRLRRDRE